jgi:hypothetical protein
MSEETSDEAIAAEEITLKLHAHEGSFTLKDFEFMGTELAHIIECVKTARARGETGINILICGPYHRGVDGVALAIAKTLRKKLIELDLTQNGSFAENAAHVDHANKTLTAKEVLLVDAKHLSKSYLSDELDDNTVITIWKTDDLSSLHPVIKSKSFYSLYVSATPVHVKQKIWADMFAYYDVAITAEETLELARRYEIDSLDEIEQAVHNASLSGKGFEAVNLYLAASSTILKGSSFATTLTHRLSPYFDKTLVSTKDDDWPTLSQKLKKDGKPFTLLAEGKEGSGMRSAIRALSEEMKMVSLEVSIDDLIADPNIAADNISSVFKKATDERGILLFNNIAALINAPNAHILLPLFLNNMKHHNLPMAVTSFEDTDTVPAELKQAFSLQTNFGALKPKQLERAFLKYFGQKAPQGLSEIKGLLIGDFVTVNQILRKRDIDDIYPEHVLPLLLKQIKIREDNDHRKIGFGSTQNQDTVYQLKTLPTRSPDSVPIAATLVVR